MAIPDYPPLPSQQDVTRASHSRLGRTVMGGVYLALLLVLCLAGVVLVPGGLILLVLLIGQGEWLLALAAVAALAAWGGIVRFIGNRMTALGTNPKRAIRWDRHF